MAWMRRLRNVLRPARLQSDLDRELAFHLGERADELCETGMDRDEAAHAARRQFGNLTIHVERTRDMNIVPSVEAIARNLKLAARTLTKAPAFSATVIVTLALGIGANSAVFSAIYAVLLRPLPFPAADRLVKLNQAQPKTPEGGVAPVRLEEWNRLNHTFEAMAGYYTEDVSETSGELPEKLKRARVSPRFLEVLGIAPAIGRDFNFQEEHNGGPNAVLISDRLWKRRFGGSPETLGKALRFGNFSFPIVGIMPVSFEFPEREVDVWYPLEPDAPYAQNREAAWFTGIGRLKPGVTLARARADMAAVQADLGRQHPKTDAVKSAVLEPLKEATVGDVRKSLLLLFASVTLLLLIACMNVSALLLSRAAARRHETSVRFSLGASRVSVAAQFLTEVWMLAVAGAVLGLLLAAGASGLFQVLAAGLPRVQDIGLNPAIVLYSLACAVMATLLCGIVPAIRCTRRSLSFTLNQGGRAYVSGRNTVQFVLVGVQIVLAVTLLAGAGLLLRSFMALAAVSPGFDPQHVFVLQLSSSWAEAGGDRAVQRTKRILDGLRSVPGIESAANVMSLPGVPGQYALEMTTTEQREEGDPSAKILAQARYVTPEYFAALRIPLLAGEFCRDEPRAVTAVVNHSFANRYLDGPAVIGQHVVQTAYPFVPPAEIRGIVGDVRETGVDREPPPTVYWCTAAMQPGTFFLVRTRLGLDPLSPAIRRKMREVEPLRSVYDLSPLTSHISDAYAENRLRMVLLASFAFLAIALAGVGLYGSLSYLVSVRRREVALRMALGAARTEVVRRFLAQGLGIAALGCTGGLALAVASTRMLASMLFGVSATDAATLSGVAIVILTVAALASLAPAVRAARIEPMQVLREE